MRLQTEDYALKVMSVDVRNINLNIYVTIKHVVCGQFVCCNAHNVNSKRAFHIKLYQNTIELVRDIQYHLQLEQCLVKKYHWHTLTGSYIYQAWCQHHVSTMLHCNTHKKGSNKYSE